MPKDATPSDRSEAGYVAGSGEPPFRFVCPLVFRLVQHDPRAENVNLVPNKRYACVELAQPGLPPDIAAIGCAALGEPYLAEPVRLEADRCTDDGSTASELRAVCIGDKGALVHVNARRENDVIVVSADDGTPPVRWGPYACIADGAYRFVVPESVPRFDTIRASWGRRAPSERCATFRGPARTIEVVLRESMPPKIAGIDNPRCGENGRDQAQLELSVPSLGVRRDLGPLGNGCGSYAVYDLDDVGGVEVEASNMGVSRRFAFAMGDRLVYLTRDNATETLDLPCGSRARFRVEARGERSSTSFLP